MADDDCIFCQIIAGDKPSEKLYEDDQTYAFMDISPWTRGHALVIPKNHARDLIEIDADDLSATMATAQRIAGWAHENLGADGVNLLNSCGETAWQTVFHFHVHVIPRYEDDPMTLPAKPGAGGDDQAEVAAELRGD